MESVDQVASFLSIIIRLDKTQFRTFSSSHEKNLTLGEVHMQYTNTKHT
jgi:hypothetical protein